MNRSEFLTLPLNMGVIVGKHTTYAELMSAVPDLKRGEEFWYLPLTGNPLRVSDEKTYKQCRYILGGEFYLLGK